MRRRPVVLAFQAAVLTSLVGGTTAFVALDKTVTLSVDGESRDVRSFARTVDGVLDREGIEVGPHDVVVPSPDSELEDGQRVSVRYGRQLTLEVDGEQRTVWTTADDVAEALDQLGVRADGAFVSVSRSAAISREGLALALRTPKSVTVVADGRAREVTTTQPTVKGLLRELRIGVAPSDKVSADLDSMPADGQVVKVHRIRTRDVTHTAEIDFATERTSTDDLYEGESEVRTEGREGAREIVVRVVTVNGKRAGRTELSDEVVREPVTEVVLVGTKERPAPEPEPEPEQDSSSSSSSSSRSDSDEDESSDYTPSSSGGLDWGALAACESGGDPSIVSSNGLYHGLYQFSVSTWASVGGSGLPSQASSSEQTMRAQMLYDSQGSSPWPVCGSRL